MGGSGTVRFHCHQPVSVVMMSFPSAQEWLVTWHLQLRRLAQKCICPQLISHEQWWKISNGTLLKFQTESFKATKQTDWQIAFSRYYRPPWGLSIWTKSQWSTILKGTREKLDDSFSLRLNRKTFWLLVQTFNTKPHKTVRMSPEQNQNLFSSNYSSPCSVCP